MFNISIWLPSPYTPGSSQDNNIFWLLASWLCRPGSTLISTSSDSTSNKTWWTVYKNVRLFILPFLSNELINNFIIRTNSFLPGKVSITFASFHLFVCNYHPLKWQYLIVGSFFLWMTIFAILETITRILYVINSKICCFNAALFSIAFCNRYQV